MTSTTPPVTVVIVDDDPDIRMLLRAFLSRSSSGVEIVGEAHDGAQALELITRLNPPPVPAVIVLDQQMPVLNGVDAAREMLATRPGQHIVLFTAHLTEALRQEARDAGIRECVSKTEIDRLATVIRELASAP